MDDVAFEPTPQYPCVPCLHSPAPLFLPEDEDERLDDVAFERFGIDDFCYQLHRAKQQEGLQAEEMRRKPR